MANPKFRNIHDATDEYTWTTLNLQPTPSVAAERDFAASDHEIRDGAGKLVDLWKSTERRMWRCEWICAEAQMLELQTWFQRGALILFPDSGEATNYNVVWQDAQFAPVWMRGGQYRIAATLMETQ